MYKGDSLTLLLSQGLPRISPDSPCNVFVQPHACPGLHTPGQLGVQGQKKGEDGVRVVITRVLSHRTSFIRGKTGWGTRESPFSTPSPERSFVCCNGVVVNGKQGLHTKTKCGGAMSFIPALRIWKWDDQIIFIYNVNLWDCLRKKRNQVRQSWRMREHRGINIKYSTVNGQQNDSG